MVEFATPNLDRGCAYITGRFGAVGSLASAPVIRSGTGGRFSSTQLKLSMAVRLATGFKGIARRSLTSVGGPTQQTPTMHWRLVPRKS
jgi:hypothetical protein